MAKVPPPHDRFAEWVKEQAGSQKKAADRLGIAQTYVHKLMRGRDGKYAPPSLAVMRAIERETRGFRGGAIRVADWGVDAREPKPVEEVTTARSRKRRAPAVNAAAGAA
jgi:transcriptional regulator with XRE-family HTH domain